VRERKKDKIKKEREEGRKKEGRKKERKEEGKVREEGRSKEGRKEGMKAQRNKGDRRLQRHLHTHVYCGTIHNSQVMETAKMPHH
jgi:hypothetical protein